MAITVFPQASSSSVNARAVTIASPNTYYRISQTFTASIWSITCVNSTVAQITFYNSSGSAITSATTVSGSISVNLASDASYAYIYTNTGSNIVITFTQTALPLASNTLSFSGTLDTISTSGTYTPASGAGPAYVLCFGGGGGGGGSGYAASGGGGGGAGGLWAGFYTLPSSVSATIGSFGNGGTNAAGGAANAGNAGGTSIFGNIQATGGNGGIGGSAGAGGTTGIGSGTGAGSNINDLGTKSAQVSGGNGVTNAGTANTGTALSSPIQSIKSGSTGGGGAGAGSGTASNGAGSGIGTGGNSPGSGASGNAATGFAAGGGGGSGGDSSGGRGSAGVIYVMRGLTVSQFILKQCIIALYVIHNKTGTQLTEKVENTWLH